MLQLNHITISRTNYRARSVLEMRNIASVLPNTTNFKYIEVEGRYGKIK